MGRTAVELGILIGHPPFGHIGLNPDNWFNPLFFGSIEKIDHPEHIPMVSHSQRRHVHFFGALYQFGYVAEPIQQRVLGMNMKVDKI